MRIWTRLKKRAAAGFTLLEVLVVIAMIGILFAIAAPSWETFLSRQRVSAAREEVLQVLRQTQTAARNSRSSRVVAFEINAGGRHRIGVAPYTPNTALPLAPANFKWETVGDESPADSLNMFVGAGAPPAASTTRQIVFDANGAVAQPPVVPGAQAMPFYITLARSSPDAQGSNRCLVLQTLLGSTRLDEGAFNSGNGTGCPAL
jgi:prepilin-type N-terminal cleavage/methylation domain-containing protein